MLAGIEGAACGGDNGIGPTLPACSTSTGTAVNLAVGQYLTVDPTTDSGCTVFAANASSIDSAEYLVVPQLATGSPGDSTAFQLRGGTLAAMATAPGAAPAAPSFYRLSPAEQFHIFLRQAEARRWYGQPPGPPVARGAQAVPRAEAIPLLPPDSGSKRQFKVCGDLQCKSFKTVTAIAQKVGQHIAVYVDSAAPANGLNQADLDTLRTVFDTRLYPVDTGAFGRESDIDTNSVVIVLMTSVVNSLVTKTQCDSSGFVAGFFFGADIDPVFSTQYNHGEIFYSLVADSAGTLSCAHSRTQVKRIVPVTFAHEFQHMISFNQHVLVRGGSSEVLWLNEALSHYAEERAGRSFLPGDNQSFSNYSIGDLYNASQYLNASGNHFLLFTEGIGTLAERGAAWLYVRYLVDQFAADTSLASADKFTSTLDTTSLTGATNVATRTGVLFRISVTRWALANWVSDLPGFTAPPELQYKSWRFRTTYASLHGQRPDLFPLAFPLVPTSGAGSVVSLSGQLRAGSGVYHRAFQGPSAPGFTLLFGNGTGGPLQGGLFPRLNVIRIR